MPYAKCTPHKRTPHTQTFRIGFSRMLAACVRDGSVNREPPRACRAEFLGQDWRDFMAGWQAAQRASDEQVMAYYDRGEYPEPYYPRPIR